MSDSDRGNHDLAIKERRKNLAIWAGGFLTLFFSLSANAISVWNGFEIRHTQDNGSPTGQKLLTIIEDVADTGDNTQAILDQLNDCLTPGGDCYRDSKQRTAVYLQVVIAAASCAARNSDLPESEGIAATQDCVARWSKENLP